MRRVIGWLCALIAACASTAGFAAIELAPPFADDYTVASVGTPDGSLGPLGGITLLAGDPNTLLFGGRANTPNGAIYKIGLTRNAGGHITGFTGTAELLSTAPGIDGGLDYGPSGVLFYTANSGNLVGQIKSGSTSPDKTSGVGGVGYNLGTLAFVPAGFDGAGGLKIASYNTGEFGTSSTTPDGSGTYNIGDAAGVLVVGGGPEGIAYVDGGKAGFGVDSVLITQNSLSRASVYEIDGNGDPKLATRRDFLTGVTGIEGAFVDSVTGDFVFSTFSTVTVEGNQIIVVQSVPEPGSATAWAGLALIGLTWRMRSRA